MTQLTREQWGDIQAVIVYGYARLRYATYLFLHIDDAAKAKVWLRDVIPLITTVADWDADEGTYAIETALHVALAYPGLTALNMPDKTLTTFSREFIEGIAPPPKGDDNLAPRSLILGDTGQSDPQNWTVGGTCDPGDPNEIHLLVYINGVSRSAIDTLMSAAPLSQIASGEAGVSVISQETGSTPLTGRESFGFQDGLSNPWIAGTRYVARAADGTKGRPLEPGDPEIRKATKTINLKYDPVIKTGEFIMGYPNEYDQFPPSPLVWEKDADLPGFEDSLLAAVKDLGRNGSYMVYRKLAQDVEGFWGYIAAQAPATDGTPDPHRMLHLAAKMVGRYPKGTSITVSPDGDDPILLTKVATTRNIHLLNDFHYIADGTGDGIDDERGFGCPVGAHVRRSNPRDSLFDDKGSKTAEARQVGARQHRIMRRGVSFGNLPDHQLDPNYWDKHVAPTEIGYTIDSDDGSDEDETGLHFFSINANIQQQFEFIMQTWNNNATFNGLYSNKDPIVGDHPDATTEPEKYAEQSVDFQRRAPSHMAIPRRGQARERLTKLPRFVTVRGGAYLFLPGIKALTYIATRPDETTLATT